MGNRIASRSRRASSPVTLAATVALAFAACSGSPTAPDHQPAPSFARCDDPFENHFQPGPGDLFRTPDERARAAAETERLARIQERHEDAIFAIPGVLSMGIGYATDLKEFVFVVGYDQAGACPTTVPGSLAGVRVFLEASSPAVALPAAP